VGAANVERTQRWKGRREPDHLELMDALGTREAPQTVGANVSDRHAVREAASNQRSRRLGHEHLAAVARRGDASRTVHIDTEVVVPSRDALAGVHPHPHAQPDTVHRLLSGQSALSRHRGSYGLRRRSECDEERIPFGPNLVALLLRDRPADDLGVAILKNTIPIAQSVKERGGPFDVGEQEGNRSRRQLSHRPTC
jgi:hypothetical protein